MWEIWFPLLGGQAGRPRWFPSSALGRVPYACIGWRLKGLPRRLPGQQGAGVPGGEGVGRGEGGEIARGFLCGDRAGSGPHEFFHRGDERRGALHRQAFERGDGEGGGGLGERAARACEGGLGDEPVLHAEAQGAEIAAGRVLAGRDAVGGGKGAASAGTPPMVVDDGLVELCGFGHGQARRVGRGEAWLKRETVALFSFAANRGHAGPGSGQSAGGGLGAEAELGGLEDVALGHGLLGAVEAVEDKLAEVAEADLAGYVDVVLTLVVH
jgi:hypothetical protein